MLMDCSRVSTCPRGTRCASPNTRNFWTHTSHALDPRIKVALKVIVGELHSLKSQNYTRTIILHLDFKMSNNQTINQTIPKTDNRYIYVLNGTAYIGHLGHETETKAHHALLLSEDGTTPVRIQAKDEEANFVQIAEELLKQVVHIDPFGMNTCEEVYESYRDYCDGATGI
ncbi:hypothetical protein BKA57DRAFT_528903 [Linnemannia elongata]|nr:hypothetical protein BKA57DRAFT_528903 [Linnemannia elongata]